MPPPLSPDRRAAILADIEAGELGCRAIAEKHSVSPSTVSALAPEGAFARSQTEKATQAARLDNAALRAATSRRFLEKANALLDQMDQPHIAFAFGGRDNVYRQRKMPKPPVGDLKNLVIAAATAFDKHLKAEVFDGEHDGLAAVDAWLRGIAGDP